MSLSENFVQVPAKYRPLPIALSNRLHSHSTYASIPTSETSIFWYLEDWACRTANSAPYCPVWTWVVQDVLYGTALTYAGNTCSLVVLCAIPWWFQKRMTMVIASSFRTTFNHIFLSLLELPHFHPRIFPYWSLRFTEHGPSQPWCPLLTLYRPTHSC